MADVKWREWNTFPNAENALISKSALLADISESVVFSGRSGETSAEIRGAHKVVDRIKAAPTVDAVPVVRCKDCKRSGKYAFGNSLVKRLACLEIEEDGFVRMATSVEPMDFCSRGERRSE